MKLIFIRGGGIRKIFIEGRKISFIAAELNFVPLTIDLENINEKELRKKKMGKKDIKLIRELSLLGSEEEIAKDIKKDFQRSGWRLLNRE